MRVTDWGSFRKAWAGKSGIPYLERWGSVIDIAEKTGGKKYLGTEEVGMGETGVIYS